MRMHQRLLQARALLLCTSLSFQMEAAYPGEKQDPDPFELHDREPSPIVKDSWTVVVLPDTQNYTTPKTGGRFEICEGMMDWIVKEKEKRNIKMVVHVGDMTQHNKEQEWILIRRAYRKLDHVVPYLLCEGNHDVGNPNLMNRHFKLEDNPLNKKMPLSGSLT